MKTRKSLVQQKAESTFLKGLIWIQTLAIVFSLCLCSKLNAQVAPTTRLVGSVVDGSGSSLVGAEVELTASGTQIKRHTTTDSKGTFTFELVPPGTYSLDATFKGFAPFHQSGIQLDVNVSANLTIPMTVGSVGETVNVSSEAPMVDTESGTLRQVVNEKYISELPLSARNAATLVYMAPGTVAGAGQDTATYASNSNTIAVSVNGTYGNQIAYKLDGASHQDSITNLNAAFPNPDALAQFNVETNNFDAQYGGSGGGVVNIVTKSGTNALHGSLFEFLRNGALNSTNYFALKKDPLKRNQFGGSIGGPIINDKLFYFGSFQATTTSDVTNSNIAFVPTESQRRGDFSPITKQLKNPFTGIPYAGNQIPVSSFASALFQVIPTSSDPTGRLVYSIPSQARDYQGLAKLDYNLRNHQISSSFFYVHYSASGWNGGKTLLNYVIGQVQTTREFKVSDTWTINSHLLNSVIFDGLNLDANQLPTAPFSIFDFGTFNIAKPAPQYQETGLSVSGFGSWGSGGSQPPGEWIRGDYELSDIVTWVRRNHAMHFGATYTPFTRFDSNTGFQEEPTFSFDGTGSGNSLVDLMTGYASNFSQTAGKAKITRGAQISTFFQDNWRVSSKLALNLGLRWDPFRPYTDPHNGQVGGYIPGFRSARFPNAPVGLAFAGDSGFPNGGMYSNVGNISPRLGFSLAIRQGSHPTTVRGGWGMFYIMPMMKVYNNFVQNAPFSPSATLFAVNIFDPYGSAGVQNPFPPFAPVHPTASATFPLPQQYQYFNPHWHLGRTQAFNLTLEQQLASGLVFRAAYVGTQGRNLQYFEEKNPAIYSPGASTATTNARRALAPTFASLIEMTNGGISNYHSMQLTVEKRFSPFVTFVSNYTYSKSLDNQSADNQFTVSNPDPFYSHFNYGLSDFNTPNNFTLSGVFTIPRMHHGNYWLHSVTNGWETSGVLSWRNGTPINFGTGQDRSLSGVGQDRPDLVGSPKLPGNRPRSQVIAQYFNRAAFTQNALGTFGTTPRNLLQRPRYFNLDWSVEKAFGETHKFSIRADFFNAFNNVHLSSPGSNLNSTSTFGVITSAGDPRILQVAGRYRF